MLFGLLLLAAPGAETQDSPPSGVIRINVNLVQIDAVVTDAKGRLVTDLEAADFEMLQGWPRSAHHKPLLHHAPSRRNGARDTAPAAAPRSALRKTAPPPPAVLKREDIRRTTALVADDLGLSFESMVHVREALARFVDEEMREGDLAAIVRTSAGMGSLQQFTTDERLLHAAIEHVRYRGGARAGVGSFTALGTDPVFGNKDAADKLDDFRNGEKMSMRRARLEPLATRCRRSLPLEQRRNRPHGSVFGSPACRHKSTAESLK